MIYKIKRTTGRIEPKSAWNDELWRESEILELKNYMGPKPGHFPRTLVKLLYDNNNNIYVFFKVEDKYVRAVAQKLNDSVCRDSCVEFFFTPDENLSDGYFNIEINCGGTMLMHQQTARNENIMEISEQDCVKIKICASMPKIVEPEIEEQAIWTVQYCIPLEVLEKYAKIKRPAAGVKWRANFYKCADATSHPHWLTWSLVNRPEPDFHQPQYFGTLLFE
jgi:hypothetical protein